MVSFIQSVLSAADINMLLAINGHHNVVFDSIMYTVSDKTIWLPMYMILLVFIIKDNGIRKAAAWLLFLILCITFADQITSSVLKPLVGRLRPSNPDNPISGYIHIVCGYRGGSHGFASSHAANCSALAVYWILTGQRRLAGRMLAVWAVIICYSRIYLGVHYPTDIAAGIIIGTFCAKNMSDIYHHCCMAVLPANNKTTGRRVSLRIKANRQPL